MINTQWEMLQNRSQAIQVTLLITAKVLKMKFILTSAHLEPNSLQVTKSSAKVAASTGPT